MRVKKEDKRNPDNANTKKYKNLRTVKVLSFEGENERNFQKLILLSLTAFLTAASFYLINHKNEG